MYLPNLTAYHTLENSKGTLDPLGLYSIADKLATRLVPGFRERMKHPRYLTAMAIGAVVCADYGEEDLCVDEISSPWQIYEWYVASALIKNFEKDDRNQLLGLPGREKTTNAFKSNLPLSAVRYLKTPSVFGFHGVYRTLAKQIRLLDNNHLGEFGSRLLEVWEKEQNLNGFLVGKNGESGNDFRRKLKEAVAKAMQEKQVSKPWSWEFYPKLARSLAPKSPGKIEARILFDELVSKDVESRAEVINFLISREGQLAFSTGSEKLFHKTFQQYSTINKKLLLAIEAYEIVARLLYNAFYEVLDYMRLNSNKGSLNKLAILPNITAAYKQLPESFRLADLHLETFEPEAYDFAEKIEMLRGIDSPQEWVRLLLEHHASVQSSKPPSGKAPWILEHSSGSYLLNTLQTNKQDYNSEYVHQYRTFSLQSFMKDLNKI